MKNCMRYYNWLHVQLNFSFMGRDGVLIKWTKSNIHHQPMFKLEKSCYRPDPESRKFSSRIYFSELSKLKDYLMTIRETETFLKLNFLFLWDRDFWDCKFSNVTGLRISLDCNIVFFETEAIWDLAKIVETETFFETLAYLYITSD